MNLAAAIAVTALVTYGLRVLPLLFVRGDITHPWVLSFLHYVPYAVLTAMTIPAIFSATSHWLSGLAGFVTAVVLALAKRSLMTVAIAAAIAVWLVELVVL